MNTDPPLAQVIVADPPWSYARAPGFGTREKPDAHYACMSDAELCALPVSAWAAADAVLLLWTTGPMMARSVAVMEAWGFQYVTVAFVWRKMCRTDDTRERMGTGYWTRATCEFVLLGRRGQGVSKWVRDHGVRQAFEGPVREHSRKPDEFWGQVERLFGDVYQGLEKLELFARESRPGWRAWGNEVGRFDKQTP